LIFTKQDWRRVEKIHTPSATLPPWPAYDFCRMNLEIAFSLLISTKIQIKHVFSKEGNIDKIKAFKHIYLRTLKLNYS